MTPQDLKAWRQANGYTQEEAGALLGRNARSIYRLETSTDPIPGEIALACEAIDLKRLLAAARGKLVAYRDQATAPLERQLFDVLVKVRAPEESGLPEAPGGDRPVIADDDGRKAAFRQLQRDFNSLPDRDAIKRVIDVMAA